MAAEHGRQLTLVGIADRSQRGGIERIFERSLTAWVCLACIGFSAGSVHAAYTARIDNQKLVMTGDAASDALALRLQAGVPGVLEVDVNDDGSADFGFDRSLFNLIVVNAGVGDDLVRIDESSNGIFTDTEATGLNGEDGNDTLLGGIGAEVLSGGRGNDIVDGNRGNDRVLLGAGDDTFVWDPGDGSDVVEGQGGLDTMRFNGSVASEIMELSANGPRLRFTRNVGNVLMDVNGVEVIELPLQGGADVVLVNDLSATVVDEVNVDLALNGVGDGQVDSVIVNGTAGADTFNVTVDGADVVASVLSTQVRLKNGELANDRLAVSGIGGDLVNINGTSAADTMELITSPVAGSIRTFVNGASAGVDMAGALTLSVNGLGGEDLITAIGNIAGTAIPVRMDGGDDNDVIRGSNGPDLLIGGRGNDTLDGNQGLDTAELGEGDDTFVWDPGDGNDVVEGQEGLDTLRFNGSAASENMELSGNGQRVRFTRNVANIVMDVDGVEVMDVLLQGGADTFLFNDLSSTAVDQVNVDLAILGGGGDSQPDSIILNGTAGADTFNFAVEGADVVANHFSTQVRLKNGEAANDRMSVTGVGGDLVNVNGTSGADTMELITSPVAGNVRTFVNGASAGVDVAGDLTLSVNGLRGEDLITAVGNIAGTGIPIRMDGGSENDVIRGSNGPDLLIGGRGNDAIDGNQGLDTAELGEGDDTFVWDPGDGNDVVEGQGGKDTMQFNGSGASEIMEVSANGPRLRFTRNVANIVMDVDGVEVINAAMQGSADTFFVNDLSGTVVKEVNVDLALNGVGDGQADSVMLNGTPGADIINIYADGADLVASHFSTRVRLKNGEPANDRMAVNGIGGDQVNINGTANADTMQLVSSPVAGNVRTFVNGASAGVDVAGALTLSVNGLLGEDLITATGNIAGTAVPIRLDGGKDNDVIRGSNGPDLLIGGHGNDTIDGNQGLDTVQLGSGDDTFVWDPGDGNDVVEGQGGLDTLQFNGSGASEFMELSANGPQLRFTRNVGNIVMDMAGIEVINVLMQGGADNIVVNDLDGTAVDEVNVDLALNGGGDLQADSVTLNGTGGADFINVVAEGTDVVAIGLAARLRIKNPEVVHDTFVVNGQAGLDTITINADVSTLISVTNNQ